MFTGIVEVLAEVASVVDEPPGRRLTIRTGAMAGECALGDSVAVNGCCLTVVALDRETLTFQAGPETLLRTNLGALTAGDRVNVERSIVLGDRLGGHIVTGHVDEVGRVEERINTGEWSKFAFCCSSALSRQMASKGSVAVDGVSLTLVDVGDERFSVALIPHTLAVTTLGVRQVGDCVNIETDLLAKYVERQLAYRRV